MGLSRQIGQYGKPGAGRAAAAACCSTVARRVGFTATPVGVTHTAVVSRMERSSHG
jgi:hypothetical protein